jgi:hypothetical protein
MYWSEARPHFHARYAGRAASVDLDGRVIACSLPRQAQRLVAREWRGVLEPLRDPSYFAQVRVDPGSGTIAWPNGIDLAPEPLYDEARRNPVEPAASS